MDAIGASQPVNDFQVKGRGWWQDPVGAPPAAYAVVSAGTWDRILGDTLAVYQFNAQSQRA